MSSADYAQLLKTLCLVETRRVAAQGRQKEKKKTDGVFGEAVSFNTSLEKITSRSKLDDTTDIDFSVSLPTSRAASASEDRTTNTCDFTRKL
jgi:hypothetical protein